VFDYSYWSHDGFVEPATPDGYLNAAPGSRYDDQVKVYNDLVSSFIHSLDGRVKRCLITLLKALMLACLLMVRQDQESHILSSATERIEELFQWFATKFLEELSRKKKILPIKLNMKSNWPCFRFTTKRSRIC
jgi:hypothetical protein